MHEAKSSLPNPLSGVWQGVWALLGIARLMQKRPRAMLAGAPMYMRAGLSEARFDPRKNLLPTHYARPTPLADLAATPRPHLASLSREAAGISPPPGLAHRRRRRGRPPPSPLPSCLVPLRSPHPFLPASFPSALLTPSFLPWAHRE